ncbi:transporter [Mycobacterium sp. shizuoka-1]|nr:transporter [Mycobacterium sp. shizuoka-1]
MIVVVIGVLIGRMLRGWRHRGDRQLALLGELPAIPDLLSAAVIAPTRGLYVGSTLAGRWLERIAAGDLGYRCKAVLTRYPEGILLERSGATPIWIPQGAISGVRTERGLAGKVVPGGRNKAESPDGILAIRWRLPSGTEIDTGFRGDDRRDYARWTTTGEAA